MLNGMLKKLGVLPDVNKEDVDMSVQEKAATVELANHESVVAELATLQGQFAEAQASIETMTAQYTDVMAQLEAANAALAQSETAQAALAAKAKEDLQTARLAKLSGIVGDAKANAVMATMADASEEMFETVVGAMAASYSAEAESPLFNEAGLDAAPAAVVEKDAVQRLADNLAAQFKTNQ